LVSNLGELKRRIRHNRLSVRLADLPGGPEASEERVAHLFVAHHAEVEEEGSANKTDQVDDEPTVMVHFSKPQDEHDQPPGAQNQEQLHPQQQTATGIKILMMNSNLKKILQRVGNFYRCLFILTFGTASLDGTYSNLPRNRNHTFLISAKPSKTTDNNKIF